MRHYELTDEQWKVVQELLPRPAATGRLAGGKGHRCPRIRRWFRRYKVEAVIPQRSEQFAKHRGRPLRFDKDACRQRSSLERCIGWLKECRRPATRFEKLTANFPRMTKVATIEGYLKITFSDRACAPARQTWGSA